MTDIPNVENTQLYSDDESSKADKLLWKIHSFVTKKEKKVKRKYIWELKEKLNIQERYRMIQMMMQFTFFLGVEKNDNDWEELDKTMGIKSLVRSCDLKINNKTSYIIIISII
jgi:hypothetical protein